MEPSVTTDTDPLAFSIPDAARRIGLSRSGVYVLIGRGELPIVKLGQRTVILDDDLRAYLSRHRKVAEHSAAE
jgi:excisionase family DNA binding protein